jgi:hypothetical protein
MTRTFSFLFIIAMITVAFSSATHAQGVAVPLSLQGIDRWNTGSVRAHGMGGSGIASGSNDMGSMFLNPASLGSLESPSVLVGGIAQSKTYSQNQEWMPSRLYAGLSLLFENAFDGIVDTEAVKLDKPFDAIQPKWKKTTTQIRPLNIAAAMPLTVAGMSGAIGIGYNAISLADNYFQNNNALSPNIGQYRPYPFNRLRYGDSLKVQWFQYSHERDGFLYGITPSLAVNISNSLTLGASAALLTSSVDDHEFRMDRGLITLKTTSSAYNTFVLSPVRQTIDITGTSKFKGTIITLGAVLTQKAFTLGATVKLPTTITRDYSTTTVRDTAGLHTETPASGSVALTIPAIVTLGFGVRPGRNVSVSIDYEVRSYAGATLPPTTDSSAYSLNGWLSSSVFRAGMEWTLKPWLALRGGYREDVQTYAAEGASLTNQPIRGSIYTLGAGLTFGSVQVNFAYEYGFTKFNDAWESNINYNSTESHTAMADVRYAF